MFHAFILGIVQAVTEFLPVSSSGHLYLVQKLFRIQNDLLPFFVWLHLATFFAVIVFFYRDIIRFFRDKKILVNIGVVTVITSIGALGIDKLMGRYFNNSLLIGISFLFTSLFLLSTKKKGGGGRTISSFQWQDVVFLGVMQAFAVFPGISRSGITMVALIKRGFAPKEAFKLSFLAAIPVILAAFLWESKGILSYLSMYSFSSWAAGFIVSFTVGLYSLKILRRVVAGYYLYRFGYYCFIAGLFTLFVVPVLV